MEGSDVVGASSWASLNRDVLERIGCNLPLRELLSARLVCRQWRQHVAGAVRHLPHPHQHQQRHLVELDAQPSGRDGVWHQDLAALATCLPHLSEIMVYVSSRVSQAQLAAQLRSLPAALTALTKLELRYIVPSSAPCLGTSLQQLQPALTALTALDTLYLIMGASPEPAEVTSVLPRLSALRDLKLLSGLPQYGFTNAKLEALGCATQLRRLHLEVSGVGQVDAGLAALSRLSALSSLWLDGLVTLGPAVVCALQQLPELQELRLELDSPQHIPDLFDLSGLKRLSLTYHGDELDEADEAPPPDGAANNGGAAGVGGGSSTDWDALERMVRGHAVRPVLCELGLVCCSFPADPLPLLSRLTSLTSLTFYDCRWKAAPRLVAAASVPAREEHQPSSPGCGGGSAATAAAVFPRAGSWGELTSLVGLQGFGMAQCVVPPICEFDLASLAAAWPGITSLQLQSVAYRASELLLLPLRPQPARFGAFLTRWRRLEALTLSGSWCNDPRVALDVSLLPPSLTSLVVSSVTLVNSAAAKATILENVDCEGMSRLAPMAGQSELRCEPHTDAAPSGCTDKEEEEPRAALTGGATATAENADPRDGPTPPLGTKQACDGDLSGCTANSNGPSCARTSTRPLPSDCACNCTQVPGPISGGGNVSGRGGGHALSCCDRGTCRSCPGPSHAHNDNAAANPAAAPPATLDLVPAPELHALEHLVLGEVRLGAGVSLELLARWAPNLRSLEVNNLVPNLSDESCTALAALTALTVLRVSQDQDPGAAEPPRAIGPGLLATATTGQPLGGGVGPGQQQPRLEPLSGMGLTALTCLSCLRQLEWLPWGLEPLDLVHVEALASLRRLHLVTLRGARDGAITDRALEALRGRLPLCDIDDTEWSGLVDV